MISRSKQKLSDVIHWFLKASLKKKAIVIVIIALILWFGVKPIFFNNQQKIQYQTTTAEKGTLIVSISASGTISSGDSTSITSNATGIVKEVYVKNGDTVNVGDNIATLSLDQNSQQNQAQAWASYLSAQNTLNSAKAKINSLQSALFKANQAFVTDRGIPNPITDDPIYIQEKADWQQAEADYKNQENVIKQAEAAQASAWLSYQQTSATITAPMAGTISNLTIAPGVVIAGNSSNSSSSNSSSNTNSSQILGTIVLEGAKPKATVNLSEIDVTKVATGQKVTMTLDAFPDKTFTGKVSAINTNGIVSSGVTSYPVTITLDTSVNNMYPNMAVNATIITDVKDSVILLPSTAIQTLNGQSTVRIMKNGTMTNVAVEVGETNDSETEIISGISEGETVVTGQTGGTSTRTTSQGASPFGGLGGGRGFGGGGNAVFRAGR